VARGDRHDGDCYFYSEAKVCTCGYVDYWNLRLESAPEKALEDMTVHMIGINYLSWHREKADQEHAAWVESGGPEENMRFLREFMEGL